MHKNGQNVVKSLPLHDKTTHLPHWVSKYQNLFFFFFFFFFLWVDHLAIDSLQSVKEIKFEAKVANSDDLIL